MFRSHNAPGEINREMHRGEQGRGEGTRNIGSGLFASGLISKIVRSYLVSKSGKRLISLSR